MYYKSPMSPPILFSVDFIIQIPIFDKAVGENLDVDEGNLDFNSLINLTNWEMQDWGYL